MFTLQMLPVLTLLACSLGCGKSAPAATATPHAVEAQAVAAPAPPAVPGGGVVVITAEGTRFAPPIRPEQLPKGAWFCDMGTVHYARTVEGDGKCPLCHMKLKHKAP